MNLVFITRKYPPAVGGMENVSYNLYREFSKQFPVKLIAWGGSQKWLPYFLPKALLQGVWAGLTQKVTHIHLGDALLAPIGLALKILTRRPISVTVHGLDITYKNLLYQAVIPRCLSRLDRIICISNATRDECIRRGIPAAKCAVIPWGVHPGEFTIAATRQDLERLAGMSLAGKKVLLTLGRLVPRKGVAWFIREVMPQLGPEYVYLIAGEGSGRRDIEAAIAEHRLHDRVRILGRVSDHDRMLLFNTADVFLMPNIPVPGDIEGFGIVAIEAASTGLYVVASNFEGIADILQDNIGLPLPPAEPSKWQQAFARLKVPARATTRQALERTFTWPVSTRRYVETLKGITN